MKSLVTKLNKCKKILGIKKESFLFDFSSSKLKKTNQIPEKACVVSYIFFENAVFYNFDIPVDIFSEIGDIDSFIEIKISDEFGNDKRIVKYTFFKTSDKVVFSCVIVMRKNIEDEFKKIVEKTSYIDYISFISFSFGVLYEKIEQRCDAFVVTSLKEGLISVYNNGELIFILHILVGVEDDDFENYLKDRIFFIENYLNISVERIFLDKNIGNFESFNVFGEELFLYTGIKQMLLDKKGKYNFSVFLKDKTFFEKNKKIVSNVFLTVLTLILISLLFRHYYLYKENLTLKKGLVTFELQQAGNTVQLKEQAEKRENSILRFISKIKSQKPKSLYLSEFGVNLDKYGVFLKSLSMKNGEFLFHIYSEDKNSLFKFIRYLQKNFQIKNFCFYKKNGFANAEFKAFR
ncbi:MAG: hypothetical protein ABGX25_03840 [Nautiliaceae bacterium]